VQVVPNLQNGLEGGSGREAPNLQESCGFAKGCGRIVWRGKELAASVVRWLKGRELTIHSYTNGWPREYFGYVAGLVGRVGSGFSASKFMWWGASGRRLKWLRSRVWRLDVNQLLTIDPVFVIGLPCSC
jgi:hypothetical protein